MQVREELRGVTAEPDAIKSDINSDTDTNSTIVDQLINHLLEQNIPVFGRDAMGEFLKTHKIEGLQQFVSKSNLPKGELPSLISTLMSKHGNKTAYGDVVYTANYEYTVNYKGAGEFDIIECHKIDNNTNNEYNDRKNKGFSEYADERAIQDEVTRREYNSDSFNAEDGEANGDNVGLDKQTSQGESKQSQSSDGSSQNQGWSEIKRDSATSRITYVDGDGRTKTTSEEWNKDFKGIPFFTTPQGEVYGFVDKDGNMYLDETKISPEHPIHEYTHLWDRAVQKHNPALWNKGVELMKQTSLWKDILNSEQYGKQWQAMGISQEKMDNLIASEVHARLTGEEGAEISLDI